MGRIISQSCTRPPGRKEMFCLTTHSTHFVYEYMASKIMVKDHSDSERGNLQPPLHGIQFSISSMGPFICTIPQTSKTNGLSNKKPIEAQWVKLPVVTQSV